MRCPGPHSPKDKRSMIMIYIQGCEINLSLIPSTWLSVSRTVCHNCFCKTYWQLRKRAFKIDLKKQGEVLTIPKTLTMRMYKSSNTISKIFHDEKHRKSHRIDPKDVCSKNITNNAAACLTNFIYKGTKRSYAQSVERIKCNPTVH